MPEKYDLKVTPPNHQRHPEYACSDEWIEEFLKHAQIGHIATRWENQPFITPTLFYYATEQHTIYIHANIVGRLRANAERFPEVCFETSNTGRLLPSNAALEFSLQYESVIAFGKIRIVENEAEKEQVLYRLIEKYFPEMRPGVHYRHITSQELQRTSVLAIDIESWSGKRNWHDSASQIKNWTPLT
jgi:uncharacterized protein